MHRQWIVLVAVGAVIMPCLIQAQSLPDQQDALRRIGRLRVDVQLVGVAADDIGVTARAVKEIVEGRLREAGVELRLANESEARGAPRFRVTVHAINATGGYAFIVSVHVIERVVSLRRYVELVLSEELPTSPTASVEPLQLAAGVMWQARALGTASAGRSGTFIPEAVLELWNGSPPTTLLQTQPRHRGTELPPPGRARAERLPACDRTLL